MKLTITAYSTALFSTWYFIEELNLLLDAGDGVTSALLQKSRKIEHIFISHPDRDHLGGLLMLNSLNAREGGFPKIFYPYHCGSFLALEQFTKNFDQQVKLSTWTGIKENEAIEIKKNYFIQPIKNSHIQAAEGIDKSFGFQLYEEKDKLKAEFLDVPSSKMKALKEEFGIENITTKVRKNILTYSGDAPIDDFYKWKNTPILIHEATFLSKEDQKALKIAKNKHSNLEEVLEAVAQSEVEILILGHFSTRYSKEEIVAKTKFFCEKFKVKIPVYCLLPNQIHRDILNEKPVWE